MKTPVEGDSISKIVDASLADDLLNEFYSELSELIDELVMELSDYTPKYVESFLLLRLSAAKFFQKFIGDIRTLMCEIKELDANSAIQGTLFDND